MAVVLAAIEFVVAVVAAVVAALAVTAFVAAAAVGLVAAAVAVAREAAVERTKTLLQSHLGPAFVPSSFACYLAPTFPVED